MNRYKINYGAGVSYKDLPTEIVAHSYARTGAFTNFYREKDDGPWTVVHSIASKAIVHIELTEEDVDA